MRISRRSGCAAIASGNRSRSGRGKYSGSPARKAAVSGRSEASTRACRSSLAWATSVASSGRQALPRGLQRGEAGLVGQHLQVPVDAAARLEVGDEPPVHADHALRVRAADAQQGVLGAVVGQHQLGDLVGHLGEQRVARVAVQLAVRDQPVEQDLDVDLVVAAVDARRVVDRVGVDLPAVAGELDTAPLREAQVAALADDLDAQLARVDPDRRRWPCRPRRRGSPPWP